MRNEPVSSERKSSTPLEPEALYAPKKMTPREQFAFAVKLFAIAGLVVLLIWLADRAV
jgi:hypothetical protein